MNFSNAFGDNMVLQRAPAKTAVYGPLGSAATAGAKVTVTVSASSSEGSNDEGSYTVGASVTIDGQWKAFLKPTNPGGSYTITAKCESGCTGSAVISSVTFGDV